MTYLICGKRLHLLYRSRVFPFPFLSDLTKVTLLGSPKAQLRSPGRDPVCYHSSAVAVY